MEKEKQNVKNVVVADLFANMEDRNQIVKNVGVLSVVMEEGDHIVKNVVEVLSVHMEG
jgi:hypothetical protein